MSQWWYDNIVEPAKLPLFDRRWDPRWRWMSDVIASAPGVGAGPAGPADPLLGSSGG